MTIGELRWGLFRRMCWQAVAAGVVCGALYGTILAPLLGTFVGGVLGGGMGLVLGIVTELYISGISVEHYYPLTNFEAYQQTISVQTALISGIDVVVMMAFIVYRSSLGTNDPINLQPVPACVIIPALIAGASGVWSARRMAHWYKWRVYDVGQKPVLRDDWN